jgi:hypothetical protein
MNIYLIMDKIRTNSFIYTSLVFEEYLSKIVYTYIF